MLIGLDLSEFGEALIEGGSELRILRFEPGVLGSEGDVLLFEEGARLLGGDGRGVGLSLDGLELVVEVSDETVGLLRHERGVVRAPLELLVGEEQRHRVATTMAIDDDMIVRFDRRFCCCVRKKDAGMEVEGGIGRNGRGRENGGFLEEEEIYYGITHSPFMYISRR